MKDIKKILELIKAQKRRFRKQTGAAKPKTSNATALARTNKLKRTAKTRKHQTKPPQRGGVITVRLRSNMGLTNMLYSLAALATYAKTYGMAIHWPRLNSTVTGKGPSLAPRQIFDLSSVRGLKAKISKERPTQAKGAWTLIRWARRSRPVLYRSFLNRCRIARPLRMHVNKALADLPTPFGVLHPRVEADWREDRRAKKRRFVTAPEILAFVKTSTDTMACVKAWVVIGNRNPAIRNLTNSLHTTLNLPVYHAFDLLKMGKEMTYTHKSALAFEIALRAHRFIGCPGSTFSHEIHARLKNKSIFY